MASFMLRIDDKKLEAFDKKRETYNPEESREGLIRWLMDKYVGEEENYYTIKGYNHGHTKYADIVNLDGYIISHMDGFQDEDSKELRMLEHAEDLVTRNGAGDREAALQLFQQIFGEKNVFLKVDE